MIHPCAGCALRFATSAELADHIRDEHLSHEPDTPEHAARHARVAAQLRRDDYTRSGWALADRPGS